MNEVSLKPVIEELENLFSKFNTRFFDGGLEKPVITVSPDHTRGAYGWCTGWKAWELISRIHPRLNIKQEATPPDVAIFKASTGPEGLEIRCENDWFNHNGRIKLTISNVDGGTPIVRYYHPDTLNRDYVAEQAEKEDEAKQARKDWVQTLGPELAHKLVDQYWEG